MAAGFCIEDEAKTCSRLAVRLLLPLRRVDAGGAYVLTGLELATAGACRPNNGCMVSSLNAAVRECYHPALRRSSVRRHFALADSCACTAIDWLGAQAGQTKMLKSSAMDPSRGGHR